MVLLKLIKQKIKIIEIGIFKEKELEVLMILIYMLNILIYVILNMDWMMKIVKNIVY